LEVKRPGRPPLVALDFNAGTARRYWPKAGGGFITQTGLMKKDPDAPWMLGTDEAREVLEQFRAGKLDIDPIEAEPEYA
jgi:hypothetical protein